MLTSYCWIWIMEDPVASYKMKDVLWKNIHILSFDTSQQWKLCIQHFLSCCLFIHCCDNFLPGNNEGWEGFMKCTVLMSSGALVYITKFCKGWISYSEVNGGIHKTAWWLAWSTFSFSKYKTILLTSLTALMSWLLKIGSPKCSSS